MLQSITYHNGSISFSETGQGGVVVLLHGFPESSVIWDDFVAQLSAKYRVITIDLPGHGKSSCIGEKHTMEEMAMVVNAVLKHCSIEKCVMIGHSLGGYVTLAFAELFTDKLHGIGLFHSSAFADTEEKKAERLRIIEIVKNNPEPFIGNFVSKLFSPHNSALQNEYVEKMKNICRATPVEGIIAALAGMCERKDRTDVLQKLEIPVLFLLGRHDILLPIDKILHQTAFPKNSLTIVLENSGHLGFWEEREESIDTIEQFAGFCFAPKSHS